MRTKLLNRVATKKLFACLLEFVCVFMLVQVVRQCVHLILQVLRTDDGLEAITFTAQGDMRQVLCALPS